MEHVTPPGRGVEALFPMGTVLGDLDPLLMGGVGGVSTCRLCSALEVSGMEEAEATEEGVPRDRTAWGVATKGGGCSGNVSFNRSHRSLIPALWSVDKSVFGNVVLPTYDNWLVGTDGLGEALEKASLGFVEAICVANVFKYFSVEAESELSGVTREVGGRDAATPIFDKGLSGEMKERPFWANDTIGGTSLPDATKDVIGVT